MNVAKSRVGRRVLNNPTIVIFKKISVKRDGESLVDGNECGAQEKECDGTLRAGLLFSPEKGAENDSKHIHVF